MSAVISGCGRYRYLLDRAWGNSAPVLLYVMLNPSTADAEIDDPTIRKCVGFAKRLGFERLRVANLYAFRATKPKALPMADNPVGIENDAYLGHSIATAERVIVAWGGHKLPIRWRYSKARRVEDFLRVAGPNQLLECLGTCGDGSPRHPLMLPYATPIEPWRHQ